MMAMGVSASAQLTKDFTGWTRVELSFDVRKETYKSGAASIGNDESTKGLALAVMKGISISQKVPLFLDLGGRISWTHSSEDFTYGDVVGSSWENRLLDDEVVGASKETYMNIAIPVNAAYKLSFTKVSLVPFFGPNFKFNFLAVTKDDYTDADLEKKYGENKENLLKDDEYHRVFQIGLNLGVGVNLKNFYFGYTFQPDLSSWRKNGDYKTKTKNNYITVGYNF